MQRIELNTMLFEIMILTESLTFEKSKGIKTMITHSWPIVEIHLNLALKKCHL